MPIIDGMNDDYIEYFPLEEYINKIKLLPKVLEHLEETNKEFDSYMNKLSKYDEEYIIKNVFFAEEVDENIAQVDHCLIDGSINIFWRGAQAKDVNKFMSDFLNIYKQGGASLIYSNPFLASSIIHLLFLRIHPYTDGNGRTARILHNIKFTEMINKVYSTRLKLSPLNISESILINKITYVKRIDNIYFDIKHDSNIEINAWFNFILDMIDEQLYKAMNKLEKIDSSFVI